MGTLNSAETPAPTPPVPIIAGPFINIYRPGPDVFSLPTVTTAPKDGAITYKQGETYPDWRINDHTVIMHHEGWFYLFWTLWDKADPSTSGYCPRTYVHVSKNPLDFRDKPVLTEFTIHAPELIQDESGQ